VRSTHGISLTAFYARRARRLLPAAGFVLLCTLAASVWLLPAFRLPAVTTDVVSAGLYVSNMRFGLQANDYFQATAAVSPVLHFWSLSVEEQFYIFWPAVLLFAHNGLPNVGTPRARVVATMIALGAVSLVGAIWLTGVNQPWAFFLLPTRAWELAAGGLLAVLARRLVAIPRPLASIASVAGVAFVVAAALLFDDNTPFPGLAAILPVAGAVLVILGGFAQPVTLPSRVLSLGPFRFLGRISYSLYLWHWPILVFGIAILGASWAPVLALAAIPVAAASQRWIEEPFRRGRFIGVMPSRNLLQAAGVGVIVVAAAFAISPPAATGDTYAATGGGALPSPLVASSEAPGPGSGEPSSSFVAPSTVPTLAPDNPPVPCSNCTASDLTPSLKDPLAGRIEGCNDADIPDPTKCVLGYAAGETATVAVFGDSHAASWAPALEQLALIHRWRVLDLTQGGCPSVATPVWSSTLKREHTECDAWREAVFARLAAEQPTLIIISNVSQWSLMSGGVRIDQAARPPARWAALWSKGLETTLARLAPLHSTLVVIGDVPNPYQGGLDPLACMAQHPTDFQACRTSRDTAVPTAVHDLERTIAISHGAVFVDPTSWLCDATSCPEVIARYVVYADVSGHLTAPFGLSLAGRLLAAVPFPK
jgi:peptidoglycan/LPS O-acetylase OafA/YrhL